MSATQKRMCKLDGGGGREEMARIREGGMELFVEGDFPSLHPLLLMRANGVGLVTSIKGRDGGDR